MESGPDKTRGCQYRDGKLKKRENRFQGLLLTVQMPGIGI